MSGAGMSVDSGLADFRSLNGIFDRLKKREKHMEYYDIMNHKYFEGHPERFWYLYGERYNAYKAATPHNGYNILKQWGEVLKKGKYFSYTSNVDGHFIKAGFPENKLVEQHGNINVLQCHDCHELFEKQDLHFEIDHHKMESCNIPKCPKCWRKVRPNILLWNDPYFIFERLNQQLARYEQFIWDHRYRDSQVVVVEIGAGTKHQAIRFVAETLVDRFGGDFCKMIRINPQEGSSIFNTKQVNHINITNAEDKLLNYERVKNKIEIIEINATGLEALTDMNSHIEKNLSI